MHYKQKSWIWLETTICTYSYARRAYFIPYYTIFLRMFAISDLRDSCHLRHGMQIDVLLPFTLQLHKR